MAHTKGSLRLKNRRKQSQRVGLDSGADEREKGELV
jgi:hypothetical protein